MKFPRGVKTQPRRRRVAEGGRERFVGAAVGGAGGSEATCAGRRAMTWRGAGEARPVRGGGDGQIVLALEVMEEAALGDARLAADVVDRAPRIALRADHVQRGVEELSLRAFGEFEHSVSPYRLVGMWLKIP